MSSVALVAPQIFHAAFEIVLMSNTSAAPISGIFSNLADGATVVVGSNTLEASYEGGDGNDLTLTVVP